MSNPVFTGTHAGLAAGVTLVVLIGGMIAGLIFLVWLGRKG